MTPPGRPLGAPRAAPAHARAARPAPHQDALVVEHHHRHVGVVHGAPGSSRPPPASGARARSTAAMRCATEREERDLLGAVAGSRASARRSASLARSSSRALLRGPRRLLLGLDQAPRRLLLLRAQQHLQAPRAAARPARRAPRPASRLGAGREQNGRQQRSSTRMPSARVQQAGAAPRTAGRRLPPRPAAGSSTSPRGEPVERGRPGARAERPAPRPRPSRARRPGRAPRPRAGPPGAAEIAAGRAAGAPAPSRRHRGFSAAVQVRDARGQRLAAHRVEAGLLHERAERRRRREARHRGGQIRVGARGRRSPGRRSAGRTRREVRAVEPPSRPARHRELQHHRGARRAAARGASRAAPPRGRRRCGSRTPTSAPSKRAVRTGSRSASPPTSQAARAPGRAARACRRPRASISRREVDAQAAVAAVAPEHLDEQVRGARADVQDAGGPAAGPERSTRARAASARPSPPTAGGSAGRSAARCGRTSSAPPPSRARRAWELGTGHGVTATAMAPRIIARPATGRPAVKAK